MSWPGARALQAGASGVGPRGPLCAGPGRPARPRSTTSGSSPRSRAQYRGRGPPCCSGRAREQARRRVSSSAPAPTILLLRHGLGRRTDPAYHPRTLQHYPRSTGRRTPADRTTPSWRPEPPVPAAPDPMLGGAPPGQGTARRHGTTTLRAQAGAPRDASDRRRWPLRERAPRDQPPAGSPHTSGAALCPAPHRRLLGDGARSRRW